MTIEAELVTAVDRTFARTGRGLRQWPDPHPDGSPADEEYSRLTDPGRYRILGARAEAWCSALADLGLASCERAIDVRWADQQLPVTSRADRLVPVAGGALPLVLARSRLGDVPDAGVVLGVGQPAICERWWPHCGCDACDDGSRYELRSLDEHVLAVVSGEFRRLTRGSKVITVLGAGHWSAAGDISDVDAVLARPRGWTELSGASWLGGR